MEEDPAIRRGIQALARMHQNEVGCDSTHPLERSEQWDTFFCRQCNVWLEPVCTDPGCDYCQHRPERPLRGK